MVIIEPCGQRLKAKSAENISISNHCKKIAV
jgi:hypothetical protein